MTPSPSARPAMSDILWVDPAAYPSPFPSACVFQPLRIYPFLTNCVESCIWTSSLYFGVYEYEFVSPSTFFTYVRVYLLTVHSALMTVSSPGNSLRVLLHSENSYPVRSGAVGIVRGVPHSPSRIIGSFPSQSSNVTVYVPLYQVPSMMTVSDGMFFGMFSP